MGATTLPDAADALRIFDIDGRRPFDGTSPADAAQQVLRQAFALTAVLSAEQAGPDSLSKIVRADALQGVGRLIALSAFLLEGTRDF